jgi:type VI secretion system protein ImpH
MASTDGTDHAVLTPLGDLEELPRYGFFPLMQLIEQHYADAPHIGSTKEPARDIVRFRATPLLSFPAEEIAEVRQVTKGSERLDVLVNMLGLHGPSSPLPPFYTELVMYADGVGAVGDFFDFFNHRLVSLLLHIWRYNRHHLRFEGGSLDPISSIVAALFGLLPGANTADEREWRARLLPHAGTLALGSRSARLVADIIASHLDIPVKVEEFIWREIDLPEEAEWHLGITKQQLGFDTVVGAKMPDIAGKFRLRLGPLSNAQFHSLLPGRPAHATLCRLISVILRDPLAWDLHFELAPDAAPQWSLGEGELGWSTLIDPPAGTSISVLL